MRRKRRWQKSSIRTDYDQAVDLLMSVQNLRTLGDTMKIPMCTACGQNWPVGQRVCPKCGNLQMFHSSKKMQERLSDAHNAHLDRLADWEWERVAYIAEHGREAWDAKVREEVTELYR